jgi:hypothetical protein
MVAIYVVSDDRVNCLFGCRFETDLMLTPINKPFTAFGMPSTHGNVLSLKNKKTDTTQTGPFLQMQTIHFQGGGTSDGGRAYDGSGIDGLFYSALANKPENPKAKALVQTFDQLNHLLKKPPGWFKGWWEGYPKKLKASISEFNTQLKAMGVLYVVNRNNLYSEGLGQALLEAPTEYFTHAEDKRVDLAERILYKVSQESKDKKLSTVQQSLFETRYLSHPSEAVRCYAIDAYIGLFKTPFPAKILLNRLEQEPNRNLQLKILNHLSQHVSEFPLQESLVALLLEPKQSALFHLRVLAHQKQKSPTTDIIPQGFEDAFWDQTKNEKDPDTRKAWLDVFKSNPKKEMVSHFLNGLKSGDIELRRASATLLSSLPAAVFQHSEGTTTTLKQEYRDLILDQFKTETDSETIQTLQQWMGPLLVPTDYEAVLSHLNTTSSSTHKAYLGLLQKKIASQKNRPEEFKPLISPLFAYIERPEALAETSDVKSHALALIQEISGQIDRPQLIDMMDSPEVRLRSIAISGLWNQDAKELLPIFKERLIQETDLELIKQIERALRQWMFADEVDRILTIPANGKTPAQLAPIQPDNRLYCFAISAAHYQGLQGLDRLLAIARQAQAQSIEVNSPFATLLSKQLCYSVNSVFNNLAGLNEEVTTPLISQKYPIRPSEPVSIKIEKIIKDRKEKIPPRGYPNQKHPPLYEYETVSQLVSPEKFQTLYSYLFEALNSQYPHVQLTAADHLIHKQTFPELIPAFIEQYPSYTPELKQAILKIFKQYKPAELQPHQEKIVALLESSDLDSRKLAVSLFSKMQLAKGEQTGWSSIPTLFPIVLKETDKKLKTDLKTILTECATSPSAFNVLNDLLLEKSASIDQIALAAELMANQFGQKALEPILTAISGVDETAHLDPKEAKHIEALEATVIKLSKKQEAYPILLSFLKPKNGMASDIVAHALIPIVTSWKKLPPKRQKDLQYDNPDLMEPLRKFAAHHNTSLRDAAQAVLYGFVEEKRKKIESLGIRGSYDKDENYEMLEALRKDAPEPEIKKAADVAYKKLMARRKDAYGR